MTDAYTTEAILVHQSDAQSLVDALNRPRDPDDDTDPGLGPRTAPTDASDLPGWDPSPVVDVPAWRLITLYARGDRLTRLREIVDQYQTKRGTWHPEGRGSPDFASPLELPRGEDLQPNRSAQT